MDLDKLVDGVRRQLVRVARLLFRLSWLVLNQSVVDCREEAERLNQELWPKKFVGTVQGISFPNLKVFDFSKTERAYVTFVKGSAPKLEELIGMPFSVSTAKADGFYSGIQHLPCLKEAEIWLDNDDATPSDSKAAAAAIRNEAGANLNHPTVMV
jgi:hypothetical protein